MVCRLDIKPSLGGRREAKLSTRNMPNALICASSLLVRIYLNNSSSDKLLIWRGNFENSLFLMSWLTVHLRMKWNSSSKTLLGQYGQIRLSSGVGRGLVWRPDSMPRLWELARILAIACLDL